MTIEQLRSKIVPVLRTHGIQRAGLFGSAATGRLRPDSDVDILVDISQDISLLEFVAIKQQLEHQLGRSVDLVEYQTIKPALKDNILRHHIALL